MEPGAKHQALTQKDFDRRSVSDRVVLYIPQQTHPERIALSEDEPTGTTCVDRYPPCSLELAGEVPSTGASRAPLGQLSALPRYGVSLAVGEDAASGRDLGGEDA